jgi:glucose/arabinose dehydrogenase
MSKGIVAVVVAVMLFSGTGVADEPPTSEQSSNVVALGMVTTGLERPVYLTHAGDGSGRLFVVEKPGRIRVIENGQVRTTPFLDIEDRVEDGGNEQGLLSVAFHPSYETNGRFFVYYTARAGDGMIVVSEFTVSGASSNVASASTERQLLTIPHPSFDNHNGGLLKFGPDGLLYIGVGDGGSANDPNNNAQNVESLLGKLLRIDVDSGGTYSNPSDNPFVGRAGRDEIYAYGLRNPWRYSFDRATGELWLADVGQNQWEEINIIRKGGNYGWRIMEGFHCRPPQTTCDQSGLELPVFEYAHDGSNGVPGGCSVTGGYVYRGSAIPSLVGTYLFADYCTGSRMLFGLRKGETRARTFNNTAPSELVTSFGEDEAGELYVVTDSSFGGRGTIYKVVLANGACDIGCPEPVTAVDEDGNGTATVAYDPPTVGGECGDVACEPASGSTFPVGTTTVTCRGTGDASCAFEVTVLPAGGLAVTGVSPSSAARKTQLTVTISGSGFQPGATVSFGKKIKVRSTTVVSSERIDVELKVKKAKRGPRDVVVTNPDGMSATGAGLFTVQ